MNDNLYSLSDRRNDVINNENGHITMIEESLPVQLTMFDAMKLLDFTRGCRQLDGAL
jgi:hypothetical protein